jgi:hypothetical protein
MTKCVFVCMGVRVCVCGPILTVNQQRKKTGARNFSSSFRIIIGRTVSNVIEIGTGDLSQAMGFLSHGM